MGMTVHFLRFYQKQTKCSQCRELPAEGRKTCPAHLDAAREGFRRWTKRRRSQKRCLNCDRSTSGKLRCEKHLSLYNDQYKAWKRIPANRQWRRFYECFRLNTMRAIARGTLTA